jgi:hypothetical protein
MSDCEWHQNIKNAKAIHSYASGRIVVACKLQISMSHYWAYFTTSAAVSLCLQLQLGPRSVLSRTVDTCYALVESMNIKPHLYTTQSAATCTTVATALVIKSTLLSAVCAYSGVIYPVPFTSLLHAHSPAAVASGIRAHTCVATTCICHSCWMHGNCPAY